MIYKMDNSYYVLKDMDPKLRKYGEAIVKEFGMKERSFHIEFFREGDDYITIEYNNRPADGLTIDVYHFAHSLAPLSWICSHCLRRRVPSVRL